MLSQSKRLTFLLLIFPQTAIPFYVYRIPTTTTAMSMSVMLSSPSSSSSYACPLGQGRRHGLKTSQRSVNTSIRSSNRGESSNKNGEAGPNRVDRRNVLLGLGGLYGATSLVGNQKAVGAPYEPPDLTACHTASYPDMLGDNNPVDCCPPYDLNKLLDIKPYQYPTNMPLRRRRPAHKLSQWETDRFERAIKEMKALPRSHPWNFLQQAQTHCSYCNDSFDQKGTDVELQIHFSWIFPPWHRYYLYFYERILGKILDDDTFALPFWNYDVEEGMKMPDMYKDTTSSLYNPNRNRPHLNDFLDFNYSFDIQDNPPTPTVVQDNLLFLWNMFRNSKPIPALFMGDPVRLGESSDLDSMAGMLESLHNVIHFWVGSPEPPHIDMGNLFSAARDPIFFGHHANVDRLWEIYRSIKGNEVEFPENDWLKASYVFYDENQKVVTVKTEDCFNTIDMGYVYEDVPVKYLSTTPPTAATPATPTTSAKPQMVKVSEFGSSPRPLTETIRIVMNRPKASRTPDDEQKETEVVFIEGIELTDPGPVRFDVFINTVFQESFVSGLGNFVGSYTRLPHKNTTKGGSLKKTKLKLGITNSVVDLDADAAQKLVVTLVPRSGVVNIGGIHIELLPTTK